MKSLPPSALQKSIQFQILNYILANSHDGFFPEKVHLFKPISNFLFGLLFHAEFCHTLACMCKTALALTTPFKVLANQMISSSDHNSYQEKQSQSIRTLLCRSKSKQGLEVLRLFNSVLSLITEQTLFMSIALIGCFFCCSLPFLSSAKALAWR